MSNKIFLPGLNGIRTLAAFSVVFSHINNRLDLFKLPKADVLDLASFGVTVFFTLSGFLITYLLLIEIEKTGTVNIKSFYVRRILRIWPLYFLYLIIVLAVNKFKCDWTILFYFLIIPNFKNSFVMYYGIKPVNRLLSFMIGHYWSLGVEEQFYLIWPNVVKKAKKILLILIGFPVFYILLKLVLRIFHTPDYIMVFFNYTRFGCLVLGALGAYLYFNYQEKCKIFYKKIIEIMAWLFFILIAFNKFHITSIIDHEIVSIFTLIIILNQVGNKNRIISLENKLFDYLGKISYGVYVYNPLIIYCVAQLFSNINFQDNIFSKIIIYFSCIISIIITAHFSYFYFEKPFLKIKEKFTIIKSASSKSNL